MHVQTIIATGALTLTPILACGPGKLEVPSPPDLSAVIATYDNPTGTVDPAKARQTLSDAEARLEELQLDWLPGLVADLASRLRARLEASGLPGDPAAAPSDEVKGIDAVVTVTHTCRGLQDPAEPPNADTNGKLQLTATVQGGRLTRSIWGTATHCQERVAVSERITVDAHLAGKLTLYLSGAAPSSSTDTRFLFHLEGQASGDADAGASPPSLDFRIAGSDVEFLLPAQNGDAVVAVAAATLTIRDRIQTVVCDRATKVCNPHTGS